MATELEPLAVVVAMDDERAIGRGGTLPWDVREDLRHFRRITTGHTVIMGRQTHESIGRALPKRRNIVLSRDPELHFEGCEVVPSLARAVERARTAGDPMPMVIGGARVYREALPRVTHLYITEIAGRHGGDVFFPELPPGTFRETDRRAGETAGVMFVTLERVDR